MPTKTEQATKTKIDSVKRGLIMLENKMTQYYKPLKENVRNIKTNFFEGSQECYIQFTYGFGASEQTKRFEFPYTDLDKHLLDFEPKMDKTSEFVFPGRVEEEIDDLDETLDEIPIVKPEAKITIMAETKNNMGTLRDYLFSAIEAVKQNKMTTEQARSTAQLAQTIINSAKLELDYKKSNSKSPQLPMLD